MNRKIFRRKNPHEALDLFWCRKKKDLDIKDLIRIVETTEYLPLQKMAIREFLGRNKLTFDNFYRILLVAGKILDEDKDLNSLFWKECFDLCTPDNLVELVEIGEKEAAKEFFQRIESGTINNKKAKQALTRLFEIITDEQIRVQLWGKIKKLDPDEQELKYIRDLPSMYALPKIASEVEKLLRDRNKKKESKVLKKIEKLIRRIKKEQA